jgi:hypothetical protein
MSDTLTIVPVLADAEGIGAVILAVITVIGWIASLVSNKNQKGPPVANRPRPPVRPRDDRLQQEINIFLEETGGKRPKPPPARPASVPARGAPAATRMPGAAGSQAAKARPPAAPARKPARRPRPGQEIATRTPPVSESLGTGVKQHVSQNMNERVSQEVQQRLAPRVDEKIELDLGTPVTAGASSRPMPVAPATGPQPALQAARLAEMLRNRASVQQAFAVNLILSRPPGLTRASKQ